MYKEFYGLITYPFAPTAAPGSIYPGESYRICLRHLIYSLEQGHSLIVLTGEIGTGKTYLLNTLVQNRGEKIHIAFIVYSKLDSLDVLQYIFQEFGLERAGKSKAELLVNLKSFLRSCVVMGEKFILIIDEAQNLSVDVLEELSLLLNFENPVENLLQIILVGQPQLEHTPKLPELTQLRQRIGLKCHLLPLSYSETKGYIEKRLSVSGSTYSIFTSKAIKEIYIHSRGIPRVINLICDHALSLGFTTEKRAIGQTIIQQVVKELNLYVSDKPNSHLMRPRRGAVVAGLVTISLFGAGVVWQSPSMSRKLREYTAASVPSPLTVSLQRPLEREQPILPQRPLWREQPILPLSSGVHEPLQMVQWQHTTISYQFPTDKPFIVLLPQLKHAPDDVPVKVMLDTSDDTPVWLKFEPDTMTLSGMAPPTATGKTYHLTFRAQTAAGLESLLQFTLTLIAEIQPSLALPRMAP